MELSIEWSPEKNAEVHERHGFGFERALLAMTERALLDNRTHPNGERYGHQRQFIVKIDDYAWIVPFVQFDQTIFLKTMFPSRKATKRYLEQRR